MRWIARCLAVGVLGITGVLVPISSPALSLPKTLAANSALGRLVGESRVVDATFPVDYLGVSWLKGKAPMVRFLVAGRWTRWTRVEADEHLPADGGRTYASLLSARGADAYQVQGEDVGVNAVAINTTAGPRHLTWITPTAQASVSEPAVISRAGWGADESNRFTSSGTEVWPPAFYPTQKLIVHHTATSNDTSDWAAQVRAIYYYDAITRGWGDIGYNFLIDPLGNIYKGRWSGPAGSSDQSQDTLTGQNGVGSGVTGAHVQGYNSGTVGIAMLGTYSTVDVSAAARTSLVDMLAWESDVNHLDPLASSTYTNPVSGVQVYQPNISGHRDWAATECPGAVLYSDLPAIRRDVAAKVAASHQPTAPGAPVLSASPGTVSVHLSWTAPADGGSAITSYRVYRGTAAGGEGLLTTVGNVNSYDDAAVANGTAYYYRVSAVNAIGEGPWSDEVSAAPQGQTVPGAPTLSAASGKRKGVMLSWTTPATGGSPISGYRIYRGATTGSETFLIALGNVTTYKDTATRRGVKYFYTVTAVNALGEGVPSNEASAAAT